MADVIDFQSRKNGSTPPSPPATPAISGKYEFHLHATGEGPNDPVTAEGFLKFGPAFIAVVDGPEDTSQVTFAAATPIVKFIKKLAVDDSVQATLSL